MSYSAFVLIDRSGDLNFSSVLAELKEYELTKLSETEASLNIKGYSFRLFYRKESFVLEESENLVRQYENSEFDPKFEPSDARVEILGESDPNMDYFNDFLLVLEKLAENPSLAVYEEASEEFI